MPDRAKDRLPSVELLKREAIVAAGLLAVGLLLVPGAVYWVGVEVVGPYEGEGGLVALLGHVASDLLAQRPGAWLLVLSPYLIVQLLRTAAYLRRRGRDVTHVTDSE